MTISVPPSRKSDKEISISDFYQTLFLPKIRPKADPNLLFLRSKSDLFQKRNSDIRQINFNLKKLYICGNYQIVLGFVWKAEKVKIRLFRLFKQKEDQFGSIKKKGPLSGQGLIKRTYLAALQSLESGIWNLSNIFV